MPFTLAEQKDLDDLKIKRNALKCRCVDFQLSLLRMNEDGLKNAGFKTAQEAIASALQDYAKRIKLLEQEHIKKYPD